MAKVIGVGSAKSAQPDHLRPDLRLGFAAAQGARRGQERRPARPHALRAGDGQRHRGACQDEHDPARLPPTAEIWKDNVLASPHFKERDGRLKTFDFVVANPPFSFKSWSNGFNPGQRRLRSLRVRRPAGEERRLRLPAAHPHFAQEHRQGGGQSAPRRPVPRRRRGATSASDDRAAAATSRASSACRRTCSTAPASPPASSCSTRKTPPRARASS